MADDSSSRTRVLYEIKRRGPRTVRALADALGVTTMGIRQRLSLLEAEGVVAAVEPDQSDPGTRKTATRGRPAVSWKLTASGHAEFPDAHAQVSADLIASIRDELGDDALDALIERRSKATREQYLSTLLPIDDLGERADRLAALRTDEGYMAEVDRLGDVLLLREDHCPICVAATSCQGFCRSELRTFEAVFEGVATVSRDEHLVAGGRRCTYRIEPQSELARVTDCRPK
ncbi:MAG: MarR family transcriptional regulator [Gammaproteobacteria bacterium]|nr:MarR family transcriptional regulator [Gammaproteobacteria bacterium]